MSVDQTKSLHSTTMRSKIGGRNVLEVPPKTAKSIATGLEPELKHRSCGADLLIMMSIWRRLPGSPPPRVEKDGLTHVRASAASRANGVSPVETKAAK